MGYRIEYGQMEYVTELVKSKTEKLGECTDCFEGEIKSFINLPSFEGSTAEHAKRYLEEVCKAPRGGGDNGSQ